ncbi:MarC family protein [Nocardioides sp.]|uniref:MarC family protein n=1 Tax=Nocardioides sp. TaxID=35761 RepID=UPI002633F698|nr:MarC family protein [Nocardioides sp.]
MNVTLAVEVFVTLFVIMDPVGTVPVFLSLTAGRTQQVARAAAWQAVTVSLFVIVVFALFGQGILNYLGITLPAMQASGGLLLLLVALELLTGSDEEGSLAQGKAKNVALVPLGTPLLAGPGAIVATMLFVHQVNGFADGLAVAVGIVVTHLSLWAAMRFSLPLQRLLRESGIMLVTRIAGLLLAAIAVQMVADAVREFIVRG